jgi:hypothetical protein
MSDIDMLNYGLPPQKPWAGPAIFSFNGPVPSLVTGSKEAFTAVIEAFVHQAKNITAGLQTKAVWAHTDGRLHTSDMYILQSRPDLFVNIKFPSEIDSSEVKKTNLLHFSKATVSRVFRNLGIDSKNKSDMVRLIRNFSS